MVAVVLKGGGGGGAGMAMAGGGGRGTVCESALQRDG